MRLLVKVLGIICISAVYGQESSPCDVLPMGTGFVNDYSGCDRYFSCVAGVAFDASCPAPFYFDPFRLVCDLPSNVDCSTCPKQGIVSVGDSSSCTAWTLCINGQEMRQECAPGTSFDGTIGRCNLSEHVPCNVDTCRALEGGTGIAPSPQSCQAFYYCYNGVRLQTGECPTGLAFDVLMNRCEIQDWATCFPGTGLPGRRIPIAPVSISTHRKH